MPNIFLTADTHFGHEKLCREFKRQDGSPARDFDSSREMDEHIISRWNSVVRNSDTVYHLGDVAINKKHMHNVSRLNGRKILVKGNHDVFSDEYYHAFFDSLLGVKVFKKYGTVCTHIPVHTNQLEHRWSFNIHGHMHHYEVLDKHGNKDSRYINLCGEHWDYVPQALDGLVSLIKKR